MARHEVISLRESVRPGPGQDQSQSRSRSRSRSLSVFHDSERNLAAVDDDENNNNDSNTVNNVGSNSEHVASRQRESKQTRARVLLGSALLQFPIWGFAMSYGVFQEYYSEDWTLAGPLDATGVIGTTSNGVMYLSMPFLFGAFTKRHARRRRTAAMGGAALTCLSFVLSSFSTHVWHLVATQGVLAALGCALVYSPMTLSLGEWFDTSNRAVAYGVVLSSKNIVGSTCPFIFRALLDRCGFRDTLRVWTGIAVATSVLGVLLIPTHPSRLEVDDTDNENNNTDGVRRRQIPWHFLRHQTFYVYAAAIVAQSAGYGIPQTYLSTYAREVSSLSQTSATLLLTLFNVPGIASSSFFGYLSDNPHLKLSATTVTSISAVSSALSVFLLWGLSSRGSLALLLMFSMTFGFFAGGYSGTWGGVLKELEREAASRNEAIDSGLLYGLLNGARGIGYVSGGLAGVPLLKAGAVSSLSRFAYGTTYGPLIVFTGLSSVFGAGFLFKWKSVLQLVR